MEEPPHPRAHDPFRFASAWGTRAVLGQVLMSPSIRVLEPLWTLIPASKAILPVLWEVAASRSPPPAHIGAGTGLTPAHIGAGTGLTLGSRLLWLLRCWLLLETLQP